MTVDASTAATQDISRAHTTVELLALTATFDNEIYYRAGIVANQEILSVGSNVISQQQLTGLDAKWLLLHPAGSSQQAHSQSRCIMLT